MKGGKTEYVPWVIVFIAVIKRGIVLLYPTAFCQLPADSGEGSSFIFALSYDPVSDQCNPFFYKGQGGNGNRFQSERECIRNCSVNAEAIYPMKGEMILKKINVIYLHSLLCFQYSQHNIKYIFHFIGNINVSNQPTTNVCHLKKAEGGCNAKSLRYYYDSVHDKCKKFLWTGCFGNGNRFFDQLSCNTTCSGIHGEHQSLSVCCQLRLLKKTTVAKKL
uniref:Si:dkeyp-73b11.8 n=1 Tax=Gasterosteus aculeatus aculeatus TaxID=481459 RepID=G3NL40_GASAC